MSHPTPNGNTNKLSRLHVSELCCHAAALLQPACIHCLNNGKGVTPVPRRSSFSGHTKICQKQEVKIFSRQARLERRGQQLTPVVKSAAVEASRTSGAALLRTNLYVQTLSAYDSRLSDEHLHNASYDFFVDAHAHARQRGKRVKASPRSTKRAFWPASGCTRLLQTGLLPQVTTE
jgi:hypothetical protein